MIAGVEIRVVYSREDEEYIGVIMAEFKDFMEDIKLL